VDKIWDTLNFRRNKRPIGTGEVLSLNLTLQMTTMMWIYFLKRVVSHLSELKRWKREWRNLRNSQKMNYKWKISIKLNKKSKKKRKPEKECSAGEDKFRNLKLLLKNQQKLKKLQKEQLRESKKRFLKNQRIECRSLLKQKLRLEEMEEQQWKQDWFKSRKKRKS